VRKVSILLMVLVASIALTVVACTKSDNSSSGSNSAANTAATTAATAAAAVATAAANAGNMANNAANSMSNAAHSAGNTMSNAAGGMKHVVAAVTLPIPLSKLPSATVGAGNVAAGAKVFSANCESCHGAGGKNGTVGPSLAGIGIKAGQVAYMVQNPTGVDKDSGMPKLPLSATDVANVSAYVASLK